MRRLKQQYQAPFLEKQDSLSEKFDRSPLPGAGSTIVARLIPPRETIADPARLEHFFTRLSSQISQAAGDPRLAGGRTLSNSSARKQARRRLERRGLLQPEEPGAGSTEKLSRRHPQWERTVSLEIAGTYRQLSFLIRTADPYMMDEGLALLRHHYPHLQVQKPGNSPAAGQDFDPLLPAGDPASHLTLSRYLVLSEHPALPLATGDRASDKENSPLRSLLAALAGLKPGEIAVSRLLLFGPAPKEWIKTQEGLALALREGTGPQERQSEVKRQREATPDNTRRYTPARPATGTDPWPLLLAFLLVGGGLGLWQLYRKFIQDPLERGEVISLVTGITLLLVGLLLTLYFLAAAWWLLRPKGRPGETLSPAAIEVKISRPVSLAAIRLVASVPLAPYLRQDITGPDEKARAIALYRPNNSWLLREEIGTSPMAARPRMQTRDNREPAGELAMAIAAERVEQLLDSLAAGYAAYQSGNGNAFVPASPVREPAVFSSLNPGDWPAPERLREGLLANLWPFNSRLFDRLADLGNRQLPPEVKTFPYLGLFNSAELACLWHLPGGLENYPYLERSGPKEIDPAGVFLEFTPLSPVKPEDWADPAFGLFFGVTEEDQPGGSQGEK